MGKRPSPRSSIVQKRHADRPLSPSFSSPLRGRLGEHAVRWAPAAWRHAPIEDRQRSGSRESDERYCGTPDDILLQGFHWQSCKTKWRVHDARSWYEILADNAIGIHRAGITYVWFPPPCPATREDGEGYEPTRWHCFDSSYGTESQLRAAIQALRGPEGQGPKALVDVVMNHRCGTTGFADFSQPHFAGPGEHSPEEIARANCDAIAADDEWRRQHDSNLVGPPQESGYEKATAGRHLDHNNPFVRAETEKWLRDYLRDYLGFAGFRYDMAAGFHPKFVGWYNDFAQPTISIGEFWREEGGELARWVARTCGGVDQPEGSCRRRRGKSAAFDFALRAKLRDALLRDDFGVLSASTTTLPGLVGLWPNMAVTFLENHDTEPVRQNGKAFPQNKILAGYAYLLTHPGKPCVFWSHFFDYGHDEFHQSYQAEISRMIAIRRQNGISSRSSCRILVAEKSLYAAIIDDRVAVKLGSSLLWRPGRGWANDPLCYGKDFAIWARHD